MSEALKTYNKYRHLDNLLSDRKWLSQDLQGKILHELWVTIKHLTPVVADGGERAQNESGVSNPHRT